MTGVTRDAIRSQIGALVNQTAPTTYTITPTAGENAYIVPATAVLVDDGATQGFYCYCEVGYTIRVYVDSVEVEYADAAAIYDAATNWTKCLYVFTTVGASHTIEVTAA